MKKITISVIITILIVSCQSKPETASQKVFTTDVDNFWMAYDQIQKTDDYSEKINIINESYINKGTKGLKAFIAMRPHYTDTLWVNVINQFPKFWESTRPNTLKLKNEIPKIEKAITDFEILYPELKDAEIYFAIGALSTGGTVKDNLVLIGSEIATGIPTTDVSEFTDNWLPNVFKKQSLDNIVALNVHEYVHTQQKSIRNNTGNGTIVMTQSILEGSCTFIAELVLNKTLKSSYLDYGRKQNNDSIKALFKKELFTTNYDNWLYNGLKKGESADLGYYVGYEICKSYYNNATDKKQAIKDIIELDYNDYAEVLDFLNRSNYLDEKITKQRLSQETVKTARDVIQRSIAYHDPNGNWENFKSDFRKNQSYKDNEGVKTSTTAEYVLNTRSGLFKQHYKNDEIELKGETSRDTCYVSIVGKVSDEIASKYDNSISCDQMNFLKNYYTYLIGMPMKLTDKDAIVNDTIFERTYKGIKYDVIKVTYEESKNNLQWYFYFDKKNHSFQLSKFTSIEDENKGGEYIIYNNEKEFQDMKLYEQQVWLYNTPTLDTLVVENITFRDRAKPVD